MSSCGGGCSCGSNCACGSGCKCGKMYPDLGEERNTTTSAIMIQGVAPQKGYLGEFEMAAGSENGGCDPSSCKCTNCTCNPCNC